MSKQDELEDQDYEAMKYQDKNEWEQWHLPPEVTGITNWVGPGDAKCAVCEKVRVATKA